MYVENLPFTSGFGCDSDDRSSVKSGRSDTKPSEIVPTDVQVLPQQAPSTSLLLMSLPSGSTQGLVPPVATSVQPVDM